MFKGIEGARAWLAWAVVVGHIALYSGLSTISPAGMFIAYFGDYAVHVFIIISGFVITHLIVKKHEPYGIYIGRRALRIFPAYLIGLVLAIATAQLSYATLIPYAYSDPGQVKHLLTFAREFHDHFWPQIGLHIFLLHGIVPNQVLPESQYMFLPPAWSLSLEWQFYLIAPVWLWLLRKSALVTVVITILIVALYVHFLSRGFVNPSFLPGAALWFLVGMATRLAVERLPNLKQFPFAFLFGTFALFHTRELIPFVLWAGLVAYIKYGKDFVLLDGALAKAAGARSYSVYVLHYPILCASLYLSLKILQLSIWLTIGLAAIATVLGTALASEIVYRFVEVPAINAGRRLGKRKVQISTEAETAGW